MLHKLLYNNQRMKLEKMRSIQSKLLYKSTNVSKYVKVWYKKTVVENRKLGIKQSVNKV